MRKKRDLRGSGELRHKIDIETFDETVNDFGEVKQSWKVFKTTWAKILPKTAKEFMSGDKETSALTHKVVVRYISGVLPNMRIKFKERVFEVHAPINFEEKNEYLLILCKEIVL